jgi:LysM repeat protein
LAVKSAENLAKRSVTDTISQTERTSSTGAALRIASLAKRGPPPSRWSLIVSGVTAIFAILIGALYWINERGRASVAVQPLQASATANVRQAAVEPVPIDRPAAQLAFGLWPPSSLPEPEDVRLPVASQPQISALGESPRPMPSEPSQPGSGHESRYVTVVEGQSLIRIAHANHISAKAIAAANHLEPPYRLKVGSQLLIPEP